MRIIFAGTPPNAASTLEKLLENGFDVVGVLTRDDAPIGRSKVLTETPVAVVADQHGIELIKANRVTAEVQSFIEAKKPDLGVIVAYGSILKKPVLEAPVHGWINLHYSLLPDYPGAAPVQHAILDGSTVSGVTVFRLDEGVDTGPILSSKQIQIDEHVTSGELLSELTEVGSDLLIQTLRDFETLVANQRNQPVVSSLKMAGKLSRADAKIDVFSAATEVHNLVRAMNPEPIAWFEINGNPIRVLRTAIADSPKLLTGELCLQEGELFLGCKSGSLKLLIVQPAGKAEMSGADWFRGLRQESISIS